MAYTKDARVPVCPLCNQPVPVNRGEDPNIRVDMHMQNECKSEKSKNVRRERECVFIFIFPPDIEQMYCTRMQEKGTCSCHVHYLSKELLSEASV
jgi:hypothetical protein